MDKLTSIRAFTKVIQHGGFATAARDMRLSRSAVSKYVIELEQSLGVQLLSRTTRTVSPTVNGLAYYERCLAILADLDEADQAVSSAQAAPVGLLHVNAPMSFGTLHLAGCIAAFMAEHPKLQIQLILSDEQVDPVQGGFDVTLRIADLPSSSLVGRKLAPARRVVCASPDYLKQHGAPVRPEDLRQHACLSYGHLATGNQWKLTGADGDHWIAVPWTLCTNNAEVLRDAAVAGQGVALLPTFIAGAELQNGRLVSVLADYAAPELFLYALYPPTRHLSAKVRVFIDFLASRFGGRPYWDLVE
ncbi:LysR family transcriptional regulator [Reyranella sp. CPCC 100927]|uniref:LysR family transcriptional regulator n=1 Tax=Reyranella sp. CPCC 100927 TaxID=2599616 RepID=UPI0011B56A3C|nr:LysR family transcriptional regulator [Reyranella sp. CPCC 100927]TWT10254.1 LysR family transcriptional regulator [Reyranella sp. CPCC 100927]